MRGDLVSDAHMAHVSSLVRTLASRLEVEAGLAAAKLPGDEDLDELLLVGTFLRRPPPELRVARLDPDDILRRAEALRDAHAASVPRRPARRRAA